MGLTNTFLSVVVLGASVVKVFAIFVVGFFLKSMGTFCDRGAVNRDLLGLKPVVLFALWFTFEMTVALIFLKDFGVGLVKLDGLIIGLLGNANLDRLASSGDNFWVVVSSGTVSVVVGMSVVVVGASVVIVVGCVVVRRSNTGPIVAASVVEVVVVVVCVVISDVSGITDMLTGYFIVAASTTGAPWISWPLANVTMLRPVSGFITCNLTILASSF